MPSKRSTSSTSSRRTTSATKKATASKGGSAKKSSTSKGSTSKRAATKKSTAKAAGATADAAPRRRHGCCGCAGALLVLALVVAGLAGAFAYEAYSQVMGVYDEAKEVLSLVEGLPSELTDEDADLEATVDKIASLVSSMRDEMDGRLWDLLAMVPTYGEDVELARELVAIVDDLCTGALAPLAQSLQGLSLTDLVADGGVIDVDGVVALVEIVGSASDALAQADDRAQALGEAHIQKLASYVTKAQDALASARALAEAAEPLLEVLPQLLGAEGSRTYLLVAQNNAEIRATGGFGGAQGIVTITDGVIELGDFESVNYISDRSVIELTDEELALFQTRSVTMTYTSGDANFTPDFPRACELYMTIWEYNHPDDEIDGVIAIDPVFLQWLIAATGGSVTAEDGTVVDGTNAAEVLMSEVYWIYPTDGDVQDAVFASVAAGVFDLVLGNLSSYDLADLVELFELGASEGRLLAYMVDEEEQALMEDLNIDGALPTDVTDVQTGIYVNNHSYSKLDWYLDLDVWMSEGTVNDDGSVSYDLTVVLQNTMTDEEAANLPSYVRAWSIWANDYTEITLDFYLYAPYGGTISNVTCTYATLTESTHNDLQVFFGELRMLPGETITVTYTVTVPAEVADEELWVRVTPTADTTLDDADTDTIA